MAKYSRYPLPSTYLGEEGLEFPAPLIDYVEADREGHVTFCYAGETGAYSSIVGHIQATIEAILSRPGVVKRAEIKRLSDWVTQQHAEHEKAGAQWTAHIDAKAAKRNANVAEPLRSIINSFSAGAEPFYSPTVAGSRLAAALRAGLAQHLAAKSSITPAPGLASHTRRAS